MAQNIKITIGADASEAKRTIDNLIQQNQNLDMSFKSLDKEFAEKGGKSIDNYTKRLQVAVSSLITVSETVKNTRDELKAYEKAMALIKSEMLKSLDNKDTIAYYEELKAALETVSVSYRKVKSDIEALENAQKKEAHRQEMLKSFADTWAKAKEINQQSSAKAISAFTDVWAKAKAINQKNIDAFIDSWNNVKEMNAKSKADEMFLNLTGSDIDKASAKVKQLEQNLKLYCDQAVRGKGNQEALKNSIAKTNIELQNAKKELEKLTKTSALTAWSTKLVSLLKNIMGFQLVLGTVRRALSFVTNTISDSVRVAAEAEQVYSKLNTVFEGLPDSMGKVKELSSQMGMATSTTANALSTVADLLQAQGMGVAQSFETASGWVKKFQDIIAFKDVNMSLEEFAQNFMSGAAGNLRNFRTFGSIVKEGDIKAILGEDASDLEKVIARANLALGQQANAVGAVKREWDSVLSVNTRLNEQWKETKTLLGDIINQVSNPLKKGITSLLDSLNKWIKAQKGESGVYSDPNGTDIQTLVENAMSELISSLKTENRSDRRINKIFEQLKVFDNVDENTVSILNSVIDNLTKVQNTANQITEVQAENYKSDLAHALNVRKEWEKRKKEEEELAIAMQKSEQAVSDYLSSLRSINGISMKGALARRGYGPEKLSAEEYKSVNTDDFSNSAVKELLSKTWKDFIDPLENMLDPVKATETAMETFSESLQKLAKITYGVVSEDTTSSIASAYQNNEATLKAFRTKKDKEDTSAFDSQYASLQKTLQGLQLQSVQMDSPYGAMLEELKQMRESALNIEGLTEEQVSTLSKTMDAIESERINIYNRQESQSMKDTAYGSLGEVGTLIQGIQKLMSGGGIGGLWSFIFKMASQLTIVQKIGSFFTDHLLPKLNALLEPLEPVLEGIGLMFEAMLDALKPLFPLLKMIAKLFIYVGGAIYSCVQFIVDAVNWLLNKITFGWLGNDSNPVANWNDNWATINRLIADIDSKTGEIANNTSTDDSYMKAYQELFSKGLISGQQYASYMGSHYGYNTATALASGGSYANSSGVYVERQNAIFNISGVDMDRATLIELIKSALNGTGSFSNSVAWA